MGLTDGDPTQRGTAITVTIIVTVIGIGAAFWYLTNPTVESAARLISVFVPLSIVIARFVRAWRVRRH
jgi:hypothetical protein